MSLLCFFRQGLQKTQRVQDFVSGGVIKPIADKINYLHLKTDGKLEAQPIADGLMQWQINGAKRNITTEYTDHARLIMYRSRSKIGKKLEAMRDAKERIRIESDGPDYPYELPELRRIVIIIDFDFGKTVNIIKLFKTNRVDCYRAEIVGKVWKEKIGWAKALEGIRKSFIRLQSNSNLY